MNKKLQAVSEETRGLLSAAHDSSTTKVTRIAVLNSHPIQYFAPLYAYLNASPDLEVTALYLSDFSIRGGKDAGFGRDVKWDLDLLAGYRSVFLGEAARTREPQGFWSLVAPQVWNELRSGRYDVLWLHGHNYAANLIALGGCQVGRPARYDARRDAPRTALPRHQADAAPATDGHALSLVRSAFGDWISKRSLLSGYGCARPQDFPCALFRGQRSFRTVCRA